MALPGDTVSIQRDTVTLNGFEIWSVSDVSRNPMPSLRGKLDTMTKAAKNYKWVAQDLANLPVGQAQTWLLELLEYYLAGMRYALNTAMDRLNNSPDLAENCDKLHNQLKKLEAAIRRVDPGLTALQFSNGNFNIPNRTVLELLIHGYYESLPQNLRPTTLVDFKAMINQTILAQRARARPNPERDDATGLPAVLFCCLSHRDPNGDPTLITGCSTESWGNFLKRSLHQWRAGRFQAGHDRDRVFHLGIAALRKFGEVVARIDADWHGMKARHQRDCLTNDDYNKIGQAMYEDGIHPALPTDFGFNHLAEVGRSFHGSGANMFDEMARCWKCRFVHHYNVNAGLAGSVSENTPVILPGAVVMENPRLTKFHANPALVCAEDLAHIQCSQLPAVQPVVAMPAVPPPVFDII